MTTEIQNQAGTKKSGGSGVRNSKGRAKTPKPEGSGGGEGKRGRSRSRSRSRAKKAPDPITDWDNIRKSVFLVIEKNSRKAGYKSKHWEQWKKLFNTVKNETKSSPGSTVVQLSKFITDSKQLSEFQSELKERSEFALTRTPKTKAGGAGGGSSGGGKGKSWTLEYADSQKPTKYDRHLAHNQLKWVSLISSTLRTPHKFEDAVGQKIEKDYDVALGAPHHEWERAVRMFNATPTFVDSITSTQFAMNVTDLCIPKDASSDNKADRKMLLRDDEDVGMSFNVHIFLRSVDTYKFPKPFLQLYHSNEEKEKKRDSRTVTLHKDRQPNPLASETEILDVDKLADGECSVWGGHVVNNGHRDLTDFIQAFKQKDTNTACIPHIIFGLAPADGRHRAPLATIARSLEQNGYRVFMAAKKDTNTRCSASLMELPNVTMVTGKEGGSAEEKKSKHTFRTILGVEAVQSRTSYYVRIFDKTTPENVVKTSIDNFKMMVMSEWLDHKKSLVDEWTKKRGPIDNGKVDGHPWITMREMINWWNEYDIYYPSSKGGGTWKHPQNTDETDLLQLADYIPQEKNQLAGGGVPKRLAEEDNKNSKGKRVADTPKEQSEKKKETSERTMAMLAKAAEQLSNIDSRLAAARAKPGSTGKVPQTGNPYGGGGSKPKQQRGRSRSRGKNGKFK